MQPARRKALVLGLAMGATAGLAYVGKPSRRLADERPPVKLELIFPKVMGGWRVVEGDAALVRPSDEQGKLYGIYDQLLERIYIGPQGERIMLSVAYGTEQTVGLQSHRPEVCYSSGGFKVSGLQRLNLPVAGRGPLPASRLLATQPGRSEPITYWTVLGDEVENDSTAVRWRQISFGLRGQILDGLLVRVSSIDPQTDRAFAQHQRFIDDLSAAVDPQFRVRVFGQTPVSR